MPQANRPNELVIVWRVTEQCNLGCRFCGYDRTLDRPRQTANAQTVLAFGRILADYQLACSRHVLVSWLGGEPFLWQSLFDVSRVFKREFGLCVAVTTNGWALGTPHVREQIVAIFDHLVISVDGLAEFHDGVRDAPGAFRQLKSNIVLLRELRNAHQASLTIAANTILMHSNIRAFERLCDELADWGVEEMTFNTLGGRDRPDFFPGNRLTPHDVTWFRAQLPRVRQQMSKRGLNIRGSDAYLERIAALAHNQPFPVRKCEPGARFWFIDENGMVAPCHFTANGYGVSIEQLRHADDLHRLPTILSAQKERQMLAPCFDCKSTQVFGKFDSRVSNES